MELIAACDKENELIISYQLYQEYSVQLSYQTDEQGTYLLLNDTSELNTVFIHPSGDENSNFIRPDDFTNKIAIAITKNLPTCSCPDMAIESIYLKNNRLIIKYNLPEYTPDYLHLCDAICRPYLLIMIDKQTFISVDFYENGAFVKSIE